MNFPIYRKYGDGRAFFEIISEAEFRELKRIGNAYELHHIRAKILPERNYITDLIENAEGYYEDSSETEFNRELEFCETKLRRIG